MATTPETDVPADRQYVDYDEYVDFQLLRTRTKIKQADIWGTLTLLLAGTIGYLLLFVVCDQWLFDGGIGARTRTGMLAIVLGVGITLLVRRVLVPLMRQIHPLYAAKMIEQADPGLK